MLNALHRKALRDLWLIRGQALAIALVIAAGIAMLVMSQATLDSLSHTRAQLYQQQRFSHLWAHITRAPLSVAQQLGEIPGVVEVEPRIVANAKIQVPGFGEPVLALMQSLPDDAHPRQNLLYLRAGRMMAPGAQDEILISDGFAQAHQLTPGAKLRITIGGRAQWFKIAGIATSAEHLNQIAHGALFPDYKRYAIVWAPRHALAAAMDMEGAFNQAVFRLGPGAHEQDVIDAVNRTLARYGGLGAMGRMEQLSYRFLHEELRQLSTMARIFPAIFLAVAAFLLNVVFKRLIGMQRDQIAILKAFGYSTWQVALHYALIVSLICLLGIVLGVLFGIWLGTHLSALYQENFRFPYLALSLNARVVLTGAAISLIAALAGTGHAVFGAAAEPVAQAMRPLAPERYRRTWMERLGLTRWLSQPTRMVLRQIERRPIKALLTILGLAVASGIVMMSKFQVNSINHILALEFRLARQYDISVNFTEARPLRALDELRAIPGVYQAEGMRMVAVRIRQAQREVLTSIEGLPAGGLLRRPVDEKLRPLEIPASGLVLGSYLAQKLGVGLGDWVEVEVLEGRQPRLRLPVVRLVNELLGMNAYMELDALNRALGEGERISGAFLTIDSRAENAVLYTLDGRPLVRGAQSHREALRNYRKSIGEFTGLFTMMAVLMGVIVNFGVVYNSARMSLSERSRELASLRVLGFSKGEVSYILIGELVLLVIAALPLGVAAGYALTLFITQSMQSELFRIPLVMSAATYAFPSLVTVISATLSALAVNWRVRRLDLIGVLKTRE